MSSKYKNIAFSKMSGTGNDFIVINNTDDSLQIDWSDFSRTLCQRRTSIGADGVLILEPSNETDFNYRIFNADGSEAEMCGNGARCAAQYAFEHRIADKTMRFNTMAGIIQARINDEDVAIKMTAPQNLKCDITIKIADQDQVVHHVDTGVPHTIMFIDDLDKINIDKLGSHIRYNEAFAPAGTNADFVEVISPSSIRVRTYERGVEGETLACGTGAVASALLAHASGNVSGAPVAVQMPGGNLKIDFSSQDGNYTDVWLIGKVETVYTGRIS